ncbi:MAG: hypothetical protein AB7L09_01305 [Nitrospira sp.]
MDHDDSTTTSIERTLLAVDMGGTMGWAMWRDGVVTSGSLNLTKANGKRFDGPGMKFVRFDRWLRSLPTPTIVAFEAVRRHLGVDAAHAYGGYLSHLTAFCDTSEIPYEGVGVGTIKKRATGNGAATKEMMVSAAQERIGVKPTDDNEADALWLLVLMVEAEGLEWPGGNVEMPPPKTKKSSPVKKSKGSRRG